MSTNRMGYLTPEIYTLEDSNTRVLMNSMDSSPDIFDTDIECPAEPTGDKKHEFIPWGEDNEYPYHLMDAIGRDEVMSQNKHFNVLTCYGSGLIYRDLKTKLPTTDAEIKAFMRRNAFPRFFLEQATDMKFFFFSVAVIILSKDGKKINKIRHKEAAHIRFTKAKKGNIEYVLSANWENANVNKEEIEVIPLLDEYDPLGDLRVRLGEEPNDKGEIQTPTKDRKFAILCKFPTVGNRYYPNPYYTAFLRGDWYDIKRLIAIGKKAKIKNHQAIKYHVEIHRDYWQQIFDEENITLEEQKVERIKKEKENIKNFVSGIENSGKLWISGFYSDPNGNEISFVRINKIDTSKEGGDWSEDIEEASNMACFSDGVHPNMVGATPGKSQMNNSGSDKRELFTMKQSLEVAYHDIMKMVHEVVIGFNGWADKVEVDVPMITLTTLDKNKDAEKVSRNTLESTTAK